MTTYNREYYLNNKDKIISAYKKWADKNPEKVKEYKRRYAKNRYEKMSPEDKRARLDAMKEYQTKNRARLKPLKKEYDRKRYERQKQEKENKQ